ncbi:MAG: C39 family peptidase [Candidatus Moraniibacteriota bacterium]
MNFVVQGFVFANETEEEIDKIVEEIEETCEQEGLTEEECERAIKKAEKTDDEADELKQKMKNAERMVDLKQQQQKTLRNQKELLDLQINGLEKDINEVTVKINQAKQEISQIESQIGSKEENITEAKKKLSEIIKVYHRINQEIELKMMSSGGSLTQIFNQSEYLSQTSRQVKNSLDTVKEEKEELDQKQTKLKEKKEQLDDREKELAGKQQNLNSKKQEKQTLIARTQNEEAQYQALVDKIESRMKSLLTDIESLSDAKKRRLKEIQEGAIDPTSGTASTSWYYSQGDSRWGKDKIAGTSLSMEKWGCAITSVAMVFTHYGKSVEPDDLAKKVSFFTSSGDIKWRNPANDYGMKLEENTKHTGVDWDEVDYYIDRGHPVIAFIASPSGAGHYVVIHGYDEDHEDYVVHDPYPWPGFSGESANILLDTSKELVSEVHSASVIVDQMIVYKPE